MKMIRLTETQLRQLIDEELSNMTQMKLQAPLGKFMQHMNGAKQALSDLYQATTDSESGDKALEMLKALNKIISNADHLAGASSGPSSSRR